MRTNGLTKSAVNQLSGTYDTVAYQTLTYKLKKMVEVSNNTFNEWNCASVPMIHVGDNIDMHRKARYERKNASSYYLHMCNNMVGN